MLARRLSWQFDPGVRRRGQAYFEAGRVRDLSVEEDLILARVQGTRLYHVDIDLTRQKGGWRLWACCQCAYEGACKHLWATLLAVDASGSEALGKVPERVILELDGDDVGADEPDIPEAVMGRGAALLAAGLRLGPGGRAGTGVGSARPPGRRAKPKRPAWMAMLEQAPTVYVDRPATACAPIREVSYVVDAARSRERGVLMLALMHTGGSVPSRPERAPRLRKLSLTRSTLAHITGEADRAICAMLVGVGKPSRQWDYDYDRYQPEDQASALWQVNRAVLHVVLPMVVATGRLFWRQEENGPMEIVRWNGDGPWELALAIGGTQGSRPCQICPVLRRGDERIGLRHAALTVPGRPGIVLHNGTLAPLETHGCLPWAQSLQASGGAEVGPEELPRLLNELGRRNLRLPVLWPDSWGITEVRDVRVRGRAVLHAQRFLAGNTTVELAFEYDGEAVPSDAPGAYVLSGAGTGRIIRRDPAAEAGLSQRLEELGVRTRAYPTERFIPNRKVPALATTLLAEGWSVLGDKALYRRAGSFSVNVASGIDWFGVTGTLDFGGVAAGLPEILAAVERGERFVPLGDGSLGMLPEEWLNRHGRWLRLGKTQDGALRFSKAQVGLIDALLAEMPEASCDEQVTAARQRLNGFEGVRERAEPAGFNGSLRVYQREGLGWLDFLGDFGFGGCLADDMGLGKTVQLLAHLCDLRERGKDPGPWLVVAPKSLVFNWSREAERFAPRLKTLEYTGLGRQARAEDIAGTDLVLTTYGTLRRDAPALKELEFAGIVLDEAQAIKNPDSQAAKASRLLRARRRLALTGTPVENHLGDLWSIFEFLNPGMLGGAPAFRAAISAGESEGENLAVLRRALRPFILRRTKARVAPELPARTEQTILCSLGKPQLKLYEELRAHFREQILGRIDRDGIGRSRIHVLEALLRLRQAACHPALIDQGTKVRDSAKVETLLEMLAEASDEGHKALVFSQFTSLLALVRPELERRKIAYEYLDGSTPTRQRAAAVDRFQTRDTSRVFLISLKAGGLGLNLTAGNYVFLLDPWWNPAVEAQAIDRTHRIGQDKSVMAYRLIARGTVEERVLELQSRKRELAAAIISEAEGPLASLTREDLDWLLS